MTALFLLPVGLSLLVLAAHFDRAGNYPALIVVLALIPLLALRRGWVANIARVTLWLGSAVWVYTVLRIAAQRLRLGEPWMRMAIILGVVAAFTALSSLVFSSRRLKAYYVTGERT